MVKTSAFTRHITSINDLSKREIELIFEIAQSYLKDQGDPTIHYRVGRSKRIASDYILASLFYEPSTRTRLSFESAMVRLGGAIITSADPATSSAAKGESLADSVRVVGNYADILIIRHPKDGAARLAAEYAPVPVINGGDGSHEHPTQTLCDMFTLKRKNKTLKNLKVAISGDLKGSRTIHSFVYALARFGAIIEPMPAKGMELPPHVDRRLKEEYHCKMIPGGETGDGAEAIDALYVTPDEPHQPSLFSGQEVDYGLIIQKKVDAVYVTRFQKERWTDKEQPYPRIDAKFLKEPKYSDASVMHPLPRVGELDASVDSDFRAVYFQQAAYGVPIRMALISLLLGLQKNNSLARFKGGFREPEHLVYDQPLNVGLRCINKNCIAHDTMEAQYVRNKFYLIKSNTDRSYRLRCFYCESDIDRFVVAHKKNRWFAEDTTLLRKATEQTIKDYVAFSTGEDAIETGFHSKRNDAVSPFSKKENLESV
jgi:aspartate carbamoyltransferase catalytic subunit